MTLISWSWDHLLTKRCDITANEKKEPHLSLCLQKQPPLTLEAAQGQSHARIAAAECGCTFAQSFLPKVAPRF